MLRSDFHFDLPEALIAHHPPQERGASRLLEVTPEGLHDRHFQALPTLIRPGDLLIFNDTRVMQARLLGTKTTGGKVEILIERLLAPDRALALVRASKAPRPGAQLHVAGSTIAVVDRREALFELALERGKFETLMAEHGHLPLPPYIQREAEAADLDRYQTVYAERPGAVAAPTAGLHFDQPMLERLAALGVASARVTLHVGLGTFSPVRAERLDDHVMHSERFEVSAAVCEQVAQARQRGGRVIAVGTTSVRSLESAAASGALQPTAGETRLFIRPGDPFRVVDAMITNFHLPESTLLMLVAAFSGRHRILAAYRHAVEQRYRFFSYGDAMFLHPHPAAVAGPGSPHPKEPQ